MYIYSKYLCVMNLKWCVIFFPRWVIGTQGITVYLIKIYLYFMLHGCNFPFLCVSFSNTGDLQSSTPPRVCHGEAFFKCVVR